mgnify:FL=1
MESSENIERYSYLDLLIFVLNQHEKALSNLIDRVEAMTEDLGGLIRKLNQYMEKMEKAQS